MNKFNLFLLVALIMFCPISKANQYNQNILHLFALPHAFVTDFDCESLGFTRSFVCGFAYSHCKNKDDTSIAFIDTLALEDIERLVGVVQPDQEININQRDSFGATPLHYAAANDETMFKWLLRHGASPYVVDNGGWNILHYAASANRLWQFDEAGIETYLDISKLINQKDETGSTPLHVSVCCGRGGCGRMLVLNGDPRFHEEGVKWLLKHGADRFIPDTRQATPVDYAKWNKFENMLAIFKTDLN